MIAITGGHIILTRAPDRGDRMVAPEFQSVQPVFRFAFPFAKVGAIVTPLDLAALVDESANLEAVADTINEIDAKVGC